MEEPRTKTPEPKAPPEISFDESVCSPEFPDGCTVPVSEQEDEP